MRDAQQSNAGMLTKSSWTSLNADANNTTRSGAMVVYLFVGETPGICWMQAVNKKNKFAYLENCSGNRHRLGTRLVEGEAERRA